MIEITEVLGRAEQGITQPYICSGSDRSQSFLRSDSEVSHLQQTHIFGADLRTVADTPKLQSGYNDRFASCLSIWQNIVDEIPDRWQYLDEQQSMKTEFSTSEARRVAERFDNGGFWRAR